MADKKFQVVLPTHFEKADDGEWRVYGLASTSKKDLQDEVVDIKGLDLSPLAKGKGVLNFDHQKGPENVVGAIDKYRKSDGELYIGGYLFKNHDRAKALYQIMSSLKKGDRGRVGMSVEGIIKERQGQDGKKIAKAVITACALTMNPVNTDTYADLVKSFSSVEMTSDMISDGITMDPPADKEEGTITFTTEQVIDLLNKALGVGGSGPGGGGAGSGGYATTLPQNLTGGNALAQEDLDHKKKKHVEKCSADMAKGEACKCDGEPEKTIPEPSMYKSLLTDILEKISVLYPDSSRSEIWETVKDRLNRKFPDLKLQ